MLFDVLNRLGIFRYGRDSKLVSGVYEGVHKIADGILCLPHLMDGQHYAIIGSVFNDGVYVYGVDQLTDEVFSGKVYALRNNRAFFDLVSEMEAWQSEHANQLDGVFTSESFGGYSYTKDANASTVWDKFDSRLSQWRKV